MPATSSLRDCSALVTATLEAGGQIPEVLENIIDGAQLLNTRPAPVDPARAIVKAAVDGALTLRSSMNYSSQRPVSSRSRATRRGTAA